MQKAANSGIGLGQVLLDGALGNAQLLTRLFVGAAFPFAEQENLFLLRREVGDGLSQNGFAFPEMQPFLDMRIMLGSDGLEFLIQRPVPPELAIKIIDPVPCHAVEISRKTMFELKLAPFLPDACKNILDDLFGDLLILYHLIDIGIHPPAIMMV